MHRWRAEIVGSLDAAVARAAGGTPTTLVIEGEAGAGKTALLDELVARAAGFTGLTAEAFETLGTDAYGLLAQLGIEPAGLTHVVATQRLRAALDAVGAPVLLIIDDLQWADVESVDAVVAVLSRAAGDRLLVCAAHRQLPPGEFALWRRWAARPGRVERIELAGLDRDEALAWIAAQRPGISTEVATALFEHTGGNPLYLGTLLTEHDDADLTRVQVLPAPAEFAATVEARLGRLPEAAQALAKALVVLGAGWLPVLDVAALAEVAEPSRHADELVAAELATLRGGEAGDEIKSGHNLVRAAIYHAIPAGGRRALHARAAELAASADAALEHRLAAAERHDEALALDVEKHASGRRERRAYRAAAHFLRAAAAVSPEPRQRERRWLDSLIDDLFGDDIASVAAARPEIEQAADERRRELVLATLALRERRPHDGVAHLRPFVGRVDDPSEPVQHRVETIFAWLLLNVGAPEAEIQAALDRARTQVDEHPAISRLGMLAEAQLLARHAPDPESLPGLAILPDNPHAVPPEATALLAWRGTVRTGTGRFAAGIADLSELIDRMQRGLHEFSAGAFHGTLARALWFAGDWPAAGRNVRLAVELAPLPHPLVLPSVPLIAIGRGDRAEVEATLEAAREALRRTPWPEAIDQLSVVEVLARHSADHADATLYATLAGAVRAQHAGELRKSVMWNLHAGLAAVWAGELGDARTCADLTDAVTARAPWAAAAAEWLRGLASEAAGDGRAALAHLRQAATADLSAVPLYRAHVHADHARLAFLMGDPNSATQSLELAASGYQRLGADGYLRRVDELRQRTSAASGPTLGLSDRERDVLTLVSAGMSYAQIARDLFITQSTVSYHLGNIYAKANVSSRHQLTALVRSDPTMFGLPQT